jgi:hypothetical protein
MDLATELNPHEFELNPHKPAPRSQPRRNRPPGFPAHAEAAPPRHLARAKPSYPGPAARARHGPLSLRQRQRRPGSLARTRRLGDNAGMARDDSWAQVLRVALPVLDGARPSGVLGWVGPVVPVVTRAAVGAGHWAAGRRRRALAAWTSAAGYGLVAWGLGTEAPTRAEAPAAAGTQPPAARRLSRYDPLFERAATVMGHPLFKPAVTVVGMVLGVWWGLRWPRRLTVLAIAGEAPAAGITVSGVARAVQRRRPRMAAGYALVVAGSVARLRAASAEPLR